MVVGIYKNMSGKSLVSLSLNKDFFQLVKLANFKKCAKISS